MLNVVLVCLHERPCRAARQKPKKKTQIQTEDLPANELNFSLAACCWSVADTRRVNRLVLFFFFFWMTEMSLMLWRCKLGGRDCHTRRAAKLEHNVSLETFHQTRSSTVSLCFTRLSLVVMCLYSVVLRLWLKEKASECSLFMTGSRTAKLVQRFYSIFLHYLWSVFLKNVGFLYQSTPDDSFTTTQLWLNFNHCWSLNKIIINWSSLMLMIN